jgi:trehalose-phosphatase
MMHNALKSRLWIFDFDGTLSELVPDRDAAVMHPLCKAVLQGLAAERSQAVAVLSSRQLDDLRLRVDIPGLYLGGGSGIEWLSSDGKRRSFGKKFKKKLNMLRPAMLSEIKSLRTSQGIEIEDKRWSVTIHIRSASRETKTFVYEHLQRFVSAHNLTLFRGPEAFEVSLVPEMNKAFGVRKLCGFLREIPAPESLVYAGDDENDAIAMRWVLERGGIALTVGSAPLVPGARVVQSPYDLALEVCKIHEGSGVRAPLRPLYRWRASADIQ